MKLQLEIDLLKLPLRKIDLCCCGDKNFGLTVRSAHENFNNWYLYNRIQVDSNEILLEHMASLKEIVVLPFFLICEMSSDIPCQNLFIDGGLSAW